MSHRALLLILPAALALGGEDKPPQTTAPAPRPVADNTGYRQDAQGPMLGVEMTPVPVAVQERLGIDPHTGVMVQDVFPNTAASGMVLQRGDVITHVNGQPIGSMTDLRNEVGSQAVGQPVEVVVLRNGEQLARANVLREWPKGIPREPIDAEAEKRFREFQERKEKQQANSVNDVRQQAEALAKRQAEQQKALADALAAEAAETASAAAANGNPAYVLRDRGEAGKGVAPASGPLPASLRAGGQGGAAVGSTEPGSGTPAVATVDAVTTRAVVLRVRIAVN